MGLSGRAFRRPAPLRSLLGLVASWQAPQAAPTGPKAARIGIQPVAGHGSETRRRRHRRQCISPGNPKGYPRSRAGRGCPRGLRCRCPRASESFGRWRTAPRGCLPRSARGRHRIPHRRATMPTRTPRLRPIIFIWPWRAWTGKGRSCAMATVPKPVATMTALAASMERIFMGKLPGKEKHGHRQGRVVRQPVNHATCAPHDRPHAPDAQNFP
jgi:hypothetical protein